MATAPWLSSWLANLSWLSRPGRINDPSLQNPDRFSLINLRYPRSSPIVYRALVQFMTLRVLGVAALALVWLCPGGDPHPDLRALAVVAVLGLLVAYHRYYDAVLLASPITWACSVIGTPRWRQGVLVLAQQVWALALMALVLLVAAAKDRQMEAVHRPNDHAGSSPR